MAEYKLEANPADSEGSKLRIVARNEDWINRRFHGHLTRYVVFSEVAKGNLTVAKMTELETEIARRGIVAQTTDFWEYPEKERPIKFSERQQVEKLEELESGTLTTPAELTRSRRLNVDRANKIMALRLSGPTITAFSGNLLAVRAVMLDGVREEYRKDGQAQEGHFVEVAVNAQRMAGEILEEVEPGLLAVHGLSVAGLQEMLDTDSLERAYISQDITL